MSDTSTNGNDSVKTEQQMIIPSANTIQKDQQTVAKTGKRSKKPATPSDGLAVAGLFFVVGIFISYFPTYSHTPSIQELCLFIAYLCYSIGFLGGCFELGKLSRNQFWETFGIGIIAAFICLGVNWLGNLTNHIYVLSFIIRILMILPLAIAAYGVIRGILYLVIPDKRSNDVNQLTQNNSSQTATTAPKERMKSEQVAGIIIAILSVITALIQALPSLLPFFKRLLRIF
jgi:hypothetical protein